MPEKCPIHNLEMHYHPPTKRHACQVPRCKYAGGVDARSIDPFERDKLIRSGKLDDQMPDYDEFVGWMQRCPDTWMPALLFKAIECAVSKKVFKSKEAMLGACERAIKSAGHYTR